MKFEIYNFGHIMYFCNCKTYLILFFIFSLRLGFLGYLLHIMKIIN